MRPRLRSSNAATSGGATDWVAAETERRATDPADRLLAIFDVFDEWFHRQDFEGCSFINVLLGSPTGAMSSIRRAVRFWERSGRRSGGPATEDAGVADSEAFARQWHILMKGSIVAAARGIEQAAGDAKDVARLLLEHGLATR